MTKKDVFQLLVLIEFVYSYCLPKDETVLTWFRLCSHIDYEQLLKKLMLHFRKSPYPPCLHELIESQEPSYSWLKEYSPRKK